MNIIRFLIVIVKLGPKKDVAVCNIHTIQKGLSLPSSRDQFKTHGSKWVVPWAVGIH